MNSIIKLPGILEPGLMNKRYVVESQYVKDALIIVDTVNDAHEIKNKNILREGYPVYVIEKHKFYIYKNGSFVEDSTNQSDIILPEKDGKIYGYKDGEWYDLSEAFASKQYVDNKILEMEAKQKEIIFVDTLSELNSYIPEPEKLYIVTEDNSMHMSSKDGDGFDCIGLYLRPTPEDTSDIKEDDILVLSGGSSETLL